MSKKKCMLPTKMGYNTCEYCKSPFCREHIKFFIERIKKNRYQRKKWSFRRCKHCNAERSRFYTCKYCNERMCKECIKQLCPQRENSARHVKLRKIDFSYIFYSVILFLLGLGGFILFVQLYEQVCNDFNETCGGVLASIYISCSMMGLGIALAIKEIKPI